MCWVVPVSEMGWDGGITHQTTTMNDDIVIICRLVAMLLLATWHLQTPPSISFHCDMARFILAVVVVGMGDRCVWWPLAMVMVVVVKRGWWW